MERVALAAFMVSTMRDREVFLLAPGNHPDQPEAEQPKIQSSILVVEDDAPTLRLERVLLEEAGYSVEVVSSGEEALEAIVSLKPALVLLDIGLPGMDGFTTCQRIRELSRVPIIMVTGRDCLDDKVKGMDVGADDYVTKPFLTHELSTRVKVVLRRAAIENGLSHYLSSPGPDPSLPKQDLPQDSYPVTGAEEGVSQEQSLGEVSSSPGSNLPPVAENGLAGAPGPAQAHQAPEEAAEDAGSEPDHEPAIDPESASPPPPAPEDEAIYEGTVRLTISAMGPVSNLISFVSELRQNPHYRLLRLVANQHKKGMDIWLGLREPVSLVSSLMQMKGIARVTTSLEHAPDSDEPLLNVLLN